MSAPNRNLPAITIAVYGSAGFVGKAVCDKAQKIGYQVIGISRTNNNICEESIKICFLDYEQLAKTAQHLIGRENIPDAFVFCHRSRVSSHLSEADALLQSTSIDIYPYLALKEAM
jgi:putative NADH-flavin reductase